jgi:hypothetical protein
MTTVHKPYSLAFDPETTRPGEQVHAEPEPPGAGCDCEDGWIDVYPPYGIEGFLPTGEVRVEWVRCPICGPARTLRDIERAGRLRNLLVSAETGAWESWRFCRFDLGRHAEAETHLRASAWYRELYAKVLRLQARARGEATRL